MDDDNQMMIVSGMCHVHEVGLVMREIEIESLEIGPLDLCLVVFIPIIAREYQHLINGNYY